MSDRVIVHHGDNREVLKGLADNSVDAVVTDPPYGLSDKTPDAALVAKVLAAWLKGEEIEVGGSGFMGRAWDAFVPGPAVWRECFRVLKPGGHLVAFFGTRTYDLGALAIRLAGFESRDMLAWLYGTGFPKSLDVSKAIDKAAGAEREVVGVKVYGDGHVQRNSGASESGYSGGLTSEGVGARLETRAATPEAQAWDGWGTALKPALEPVFFGRKPLIGTVAANVLKHGTGALNVDACRIECAPGDYSTGGVNDLDGTGWGHKVAARTEQHPAGRFPANVLHDESDEVLACFPETKVGGSVQKGGTNPNPASWGAERTDTFKAYGGDEGSAARFFYSAKADAGDRLGSDHPTVKPADLMAWLVRLVTPPGGVVLDPFAGTGSTGLAARAGGFSAILVEREAKHVEDIRLRLAHAEGRAPHSGQLKARNKVAKVKADDLFGGDA